MKTFMIALIFVFAPSWSLAQTGVGQQNPKPKTKVHTKYIKENRSSSRDERTRFQSR
jgi:hypothetical protein